MQLQQSSIRIGALLSLLGGVLVFLSVFFLPMTFGAGGGSYTPTSEWTVLDFYLQYFSPLAAALLTLPLLSVVFVAGMSIFSFFREPSSGMLIWRRRAALAALIIQGTAGTGMAFLYAFGFSFGAGFWSILLGLAIMFVGTFLN